MGGIDDVNLRAAWLSSRLGHTGLALPRVSDRCAAACAVLVFHYATGASCLAREHAAPELALIDPTRRAAPSAHDRH